MTSKKLFDAPPGAVAQVSVIDSTLRLKRMPATYLLAPPVAGFPELPTIPEWSFLIESPGGKSAVFDLGIPPDIESFAPVIAEKLKGSGWDVKADQHVADILRKHGKEPAQINSVIWSHWHWDHIGDPATFPGSTELVVGPGFKKTFLPGYPAQPGSPVRESYFAGRELREISFEDADGALKIGAFRAHDFFGDGSFYLLDTPGHAIGHLAGLARTSQNPDTFIFMGGDLCHHAAEIRPSAHLKYPQEITLPLVESLRAQRSICPGADGFHALHEKHGRGRDEPLFVPSMGSDIPLAIKTIKAAQDADADPNMFFIFAHDLSILGVVDLFPLKANDWKKQGWKDKVFWAFLEDLLPAAGLDG